MNYMLLSQQYLFEGTGNWKLEIPSGLLSFDY